MGVHCYPNEFLVRALLGTYPKLNISHEYEGKNVCDWGFGDGRNIILLHNCGLKIHGFEITKQICDDVTERMQRFGIETDLRVGRSKEVPFDDEMFDYVVASSSIYYIDKESSFDENLKELKRVTKQGGYVVMTLAHPLTFMLKNSIKLGEGYYQVTDDPYKLRNGDVFRAFSSEEEILKTFSHSFENICIGMQNEDYYGMHIQLWLVVMRKKAIGG